MWLLSFWIQNIIYITIVSGFGVILLVIVALSIDGIDDENLTNKTNFKMEKSFSQKILTNKLLLLG
jgi:hypothetical protein